MISFLQFLENQECQGMIGPVYHGTQQDFEGFDPNKIHILDKQQAIPLNKKLTTFRQFL